MRVVQVLQESWGSLGAQFRDDGRDADEVMDACPDTLKRWRSFSRRHKTGGSFLLSDDVEVTARRSALLRSGDHGTIQLHVPGRKVKSSRL
jgi:hypothetical protein